MNESPGKDQRHREWTGHKKAMVDERIVQVHDERGVFLIYDGSGKDKSSSAFGVVAWILDHGMGVGIVQSVKDTASTSEGAFFRRFPGEVNYHVVGEGLTWETRDRQRDIVKAEAAWRAAA